MSYKTHFIETSIKANALKFGPFELKTKRISPYFFNAGSFNDGELLVAAGDAYAMTIITNDIDCDTVFGPSYKGIPLATTTVTSLTRFKRPHVKYSSNRKEVKDHGDGGIVLGAKPGPKTLIVDDVITSGSSIKESIDFIRANGGDVCGAIVLLNRQEKGVDANKQMTQTSAIQDVERDFGIKVYSVINLDDILAYTKDNPTYQEYAPQIEKYRAQYGIAV